MSESQLSQDLQDALNETTAGLLAPADAAARARTRGRRRRSGRWLLAVVPAVGVIAGVVAIAQGGSPPAHEPTALPAQSTGVHTDAYITQRIKTVLASADNYIIRTSATSAPGQVTITYLDPVTGTTRSVVTGAGDKATYWIQTTVGGDKDHWRTTYVDYTKHTWWTKTSHSGSLGKDTSSIPVLSAQTPPSLISKALALGELRIGRKGQINGHAAIELVYAGKLADKAEAVHYWVNAATYQPVRIDMPPFTAASTVAESWIPKSATNVTRTDKPQIPHGFRQVPPSSAFN